jgi:predicted lipoprotein with Yx(FWY)xxD motif
MMIGNGMAVLIVGLAFSGTALAQAPAETTAAMMTSNAGMTLHLWSKDQQPGDMTGDGFNGICHVVKD